MNLPKITEEIHFKIYNNPELEGLDFILAKSNGETFFLTDNLCFKEIKNKESLLQLAAVFKSAYDKWDEAENLQDTHEVHK